MADRPIIFSGPMVRALLEGRKTQTRRLACKPQPGVPLNPSRWRRVKPGDRLWVREAWHPVIEGHPVALYRADDKIVYHDTGRWDDRLIYEKPERWRPSIHMPRWASRLTLLVTDVKVERLQEIGEADAKAEGAYQCANGWSYGSSPLAGSTARGAFYCLWNSIHSPNAWNANPWVVVLSFNAHRCNIDNMEAAA